MNINMKNLTFSILITALIGFSMGFTGSSNQGLIVVNPGAVGAACSQGVSLLAECPSGTTIVGGGCDFTQGKEAVAQVSPQISYLDNNVSCDYTCTESGQNTNIGLVVIAVCASVN